MTIKKNFLAGAISSALVSSLAGIGVCSAATIVVNTTSDGFVLGGTSCTLRSAVAAANSNSATNGCPTGSAAEPDLIVFDPSILGGTITLQNGRIPIESSLTIEKDLSSRRPITISAAGDSGHFLVFDGVFANVSNVTLRGLTLIDGQESSYGGSVHNAQENLTIDSCRFDNNLVTAGDSGGGAIFSSLGPLTITDSILSNNTSALAGGAIAMVGGTLTLTNSDLTDNQATYGGGISGTADLDNNHPPIIVQGGEINTNTATHSGGGIRSTGVVMLTDVTLANNSAAVDGGGIEGRSGVSQLFFENSQLTGNTAGEIGGAIWAAENATIDMTNTQVTGNLATDAGGAIFSLGTTTVIDSTVSANTVTDETSRGGGINHSSDGSLSVRGSVLSSNIGPIGAAIFSSGPTSVSESTFSENSAVFAGAALYVNDSLNVSRSTIAGNTAPNSAAIATLSLEETSLANVTVSNNTSTGNGSVLYPAAIYAFSPLTIRNSTLIGNASNAVTKANGFGPWNMFNTVIFDSALSDCVDQVTPMDQNINNFIGDASCAADAVNLLTGDPMLGPLADNGGPTLTHTPLSGSPVIDAGTIVGCPDFDQTGMPMPIDGNADNDAECDIGSVEFVDIFPPITTLSQAPDITSAGGSSVQLEVTYTDLDGTVDFSSVGVSDLSVEPGPLSVQSVALSGTATQLVVDYTVAAPGGNWDALDSGVYTVSINTEEVLDTATTGANAVSAGQLGSFSVVIAEIDVQGAGTSIADGDSSPSSSDNTDFGDVSLQSTASRIFSIANIGGGTISLTAPVEVFGDGFSVTQPLVTELGAGQSTQFQVQFSPALAGNVSGQVSIVSNDADENLYTFAVAANGVVPAEVIFLDGFEQP